MSWNQIFEEFIGDYRLKGQDKVSVVTSEDLAQLRSADYSVEDLFNYLTLHYQSLLHGSRNEILEGHLRPNSQGEVFCSDLASIAIMRAIISNRGLSYPGLEYPYFMDNEHPLEVKIHGMQKDTIGEKGFVYTIPTRAGFVNKPEGSWQYVKHGENAKISAKVEVLKSDFTYPVYDVTNSRRIQ